MTAPLPKSIERSVAFFVPAACREEVLGDLYESSPSVRRFVVAAMQVIPMVVLSRIRRTADPQLVVIQAASLLLCFTGAAQLWGDKGIIQGAGLLRLVIPIGLILVGSLIEGAYARSSEQLIVRVFTAPLLGLGFAYAAQWLTALCNPDLMLPNAVLLYGGAAGGLFCAAVRLSFPVTLERGKQAMGPPFHVSRLAPPARVVSQALMVLKVFAAVVVLAWASGRVGGNTAAIVMLLIAIAVIIFRELSRTL